MKKSFIVLLILSGLCNAQNNLDYYINAALKNSPAIKEYENSKSLSDLERKLINAENVLPQISLTANYRFNPYFNNNGKLISSDPRPEAIGYDVAITDGGLYSAQFNIEKNIFNGGLVGALEEQQDVAVKSQNNKIQFEEHNIRKDVTEQYLAALQSQLNYSFASEILNNIKDQLKILGGLVQQGLAKQSDYLLLKVEEGNQSIELNSTLSEFKNNLLSLYSICGITDTQSVSLEKISLKIDPSKYGSNFYSKYEVDSLSNSAQQKLFETKYLPQVKVFFNTGLNAVELKGIQRKFGLSAGVDFSLPIYDGSQRDITRQQNKINQKTISDYKNYFSVQRQNMRSGFLGKIKSIDDNMKKLTGQIKDYETILNMKKKELDNGQISMVEYLTILKSYIEMKKNLIGMEVDYQTQINNYNYWNW